jgi:hypothetical protein
MASMDIAEFLAARWDERAAAAKAAGYGAAGDYLWQEVDPDRMPGLIGTGCGDVVTFNQGTPAYAVSPSRGQATHIALNDPAAVLADIAAKRAILAEHVRAPWFTEDTLARWRSGGHVPEERIAAAAASASCARCHKVIPDAAVDEDRCADFDYPCPTVRLLAVPFASHPDYDPSWRPEQ